MNGVGGQGQQVDTALFERALRIEAGQQQQIVDQEAHPARLAFDTGHQHLDVAGRTLAVELGEAADSGQRGVRNSWLASVMNRRIRSSEVRACSALSTDEAIAVWI